MQDLNGEFRSYNGSDIPFKRLGHGTLRGFLEEIPDVVCLNVLDGGRILCRAVADSSTVHIARMVARQKQPSKGSGRGARGPAGGQRQQESVTINAVGEELVILKKKQKEQGNPRNFFGH